MKKVTNPFQVFSPINRGPLHYDGVSQKDIDIELMTNLENEQPSIKAYAVVNTIYKVRCNMQHGEKHFEEYQRILLEPLIRILDTIVELQIRKLIK